MTEEQIQRQIKETVHEVLELLAERQVPIFVAITALNYCSAYTGKATGLNSDVAIEHYTTVLKDINDSYAHPYH